MIVRNTCSDGPREFEPIIYINFELKTISLESVLYLFTIAYFQLPVPAISRLPRELEKAGFQLYFWSVKTKPHSTSSNNNLCKIFINNLK